jgi:hypothetical protein
VVLATACHECQRSAGRSDDQMTISKSQIDRLGDRLKGNQATDDDLRLLDEFRGSFFPAY